MSNPTVVQSADGSKVIKFAKILGSHGLVVVQRNGNGELKPVLPAQYLHMSGETLTSDINQAWLTNFAFAQSGKDVYLKTCKRKRQKPALLAIKKIKI